jgi:hypothetical protein
MAGIGKPAGCVNMLKWGIKDAWRRMVYCLLQLDNRLQNHMFGELCTVRKSQVLSNGEKHEHLILRGKW